MGAPGWVALSPSILMFILIHPHPPLPSRFWPSCCTSSLWRIRKHLISTAIPKRKPTQACFWSQGEHADSQPVSVFPSKALSAQLPKSVQQAACWAWLGFFLRLVTLGLGWVEDESPLQPSIKLLVSDPSNPSKSNTRHLSKRFGDIALHIEGHETFTKKKILTPDYDLFMTRIHGNSSQLEPPAAWERSAGFEFTDSPVMRDPEHSEFVYISSAAIAGGQSGWIALEFWGSVPAPLWRKNSSSTKARVHRPSKTTKYDQNWKFANSSEPSAWCLSNHPYKQLKHAFSGWRVACSVFTGGLWCSIRCDDVVYDFGWHTFNALHPCSNPASFPRPSKMLRSSHLNPSQLCSRTRDVLCGVPHPWWSNLRVRNSDFYVARKNHALLCTLFLRGFFQRDDGDIAVITSWEHLWSI